MRLVKTFESFKKNKLSVIEVCCNVNCKEDIAGLAYEDYEVNLYVNHKFVVDLRLILDEAIVYTELIDKIDWNEMFADREVEELEHVD